MIIDVILTPFELPDLAKRDLRATACVVFDILRATSAIVTALRNGAAAVIPVSEISEALEIKRKKPRVLTAGERRGVKIRAQGKEFDFGNSPREFAPDKVKGRTIVSTTTNGTRALRACAHAKTVLAASFLNMGATAGFLRGQKLETIVLICAGTGEDAAFEDVVAAGALCEKLLVGAKKTLAMSDSARIALAAFRESSADLARMIGESENARRLLAMPDLREDVAFCLRHDVIDLVAGMKHGKITVFGKG